MPATPPTGTVTLLFTDIQGSTELWDQMRDTFRPVLDRHHELIRSVIERRDGYEVKTIGDSFMVVFARATDAVQCAVDIQLEFAKEPWQPEIGELLVRIGVHTGEPLLGRDANGRPDYIGSASNRAARIEAAGHGGQILISSVTHGILQRELTGGLQFADLGHHRLKGLEHEEHLFEVRHPDLPPREFPPIHTLDTQHTNLPVQLTTFIGREKELAELRELLNKPETRLLTLTGAGGCGKTRLALRAAADALDECPDGVWAVELAPLTDPALLAQSVASELALKEEPNRPLMQTLTDFLKRRKVLLVIDNCEHLIAACAQLADTLLKACPNLRILATSREALGIAGETSWRVPSLSLPDPQSVGAVFDRDAVSALTQYEAVRLFIERAVAAKKDFTVTNQNAPAVAQVCHRLDGIPLAIELAAARVRVLAVEQIAQRLDDRFRLLTGGSRSALPRQQTLRAAIDWSYELLTEPERKLLRRLSVFAGGWKLEAVEVVCSRDGVEELEVLDLLSRLVDKSLVMMDSTAVAEARYGMLETVRQYAQERLLESGETLMCRGKHLEFFLALAERVEPELEGLNRIQWIDCLKTDYDNIRAALVWSQSEKGTSETALRLAGALAAFWSLCWYGSEGLRWLENAVKGSPNAPAALRAKALLHAGQLGRWFRRLTETRSALEQSLALYRDLDDRRGTARALCSLAQVLLWTGELSSARALLEESLELRRQIEDKQGIAESLSLFGSAYLQDTSSRRALFEQALAIHRELDDKWRIAEVLNDFGYFSCWDEGNPLSARFMLQEALAINRELGDMRRITASLGGLAGVCHALGEYEDARSLYLEGATLSRQSGGDGGWTARMLFHLSSLACEQGDYENALQHSHEGATLYREEGSMWGIASALGIDADVALHQGDYARARSFHEQRLAIYREIGLNGGVASCLGCLGRVALSEGDCPSARSLCEESLEISRRYFFHCPVTAAALRNLANVAVKEGNFAEARSLAEESLALNRELGGKWGLAASLVGLANLEMRDGRYDEAQRLYREGLTCYQDIGSRFEIAKTLEAIAAMSGATGEPKRAARLLGATEALREKLGTPIHPCDRAEYEENVAPVRAALSKEAFAAAWAKGRAMTLEQAIEYVLNGMDSP